MHRIVATTVVTRDTGVRHPHALGWFTVLFTALAVMFITLAATHDSRHSPIFIAIAIASGAVASVLSVWLLCLMTQDSNPCLRAWCCMDYDTKHMHGHDAFFYKQKRCCGVLFGFDIVADSEADVVNAGP